MSKKNETTNNSKPMTHDALSAAVITQLDKWIDDSKKQAETFQKAGMDIAAMGSNAMAQAYWNVKQFIDVNAS